MDKTIFSEGQIFGKWKLLSYLGGGGNGEVWICSNKEGVVSGAIKLLKLLNTKSYARFLDEAKIIEENSDIDGIIPILDKFLPSELKNNIPFFVMPIAQSVENQLYGKSIEVKIAAVLEICQTLSRLHKQGISHRDLKPANLLIYKSRYSIADFGLVDYPDKKDVSRQNEPIGAKWTIAPEMKRESHKADGLKADIYSLAKTLWIILTENSKGFDGQYTTSSFLEFRHFYKDKYTTPIDTLLSRCTDNDPNSRPNIHEFISILEEWKILNENFHQRNQEQWFEIQSKLFPTSFPKRVIWENINDIVKVLKVICTYNNLNHIFFPNGGGLDLEDVRLSVENGCIELDFQLIKIVKPQRLIFESFNYTSEWNYFRLELNELEPSGVYKTDEGEEPYEINHSEEHVSELYPGKYDKYEIVEHRFDYQDMGYQIPESARHVTRFFRGAFVIFNKRSPYNLNPTTYDGRHNRMDTEQFRNYIQDNVDDFKQKKKAVFNLEI
jgi:serine/threonine protein kinase